MKRNRILLGAALVLATPLATAQQSQDAGLRELKVRAANAEPHAAQSHTAQLHNSQPGGAQHGGQTWHDILGKNVQDTAPRPMIGVRVSGVSGAVAAQLPPDALPALLLTSVFEDSPAQKAGLQVNDVIAKIDGESNVTVKTLTETIARKGTGSHVTLDVLRGGSNRIFNVPIADLKPSQGNPVLDLHEHLGALHGQGAWPQFGVTPEGDIMVQKGQDGSWLATDATTDILHHWRNQQTEGPHDGQGSSHYLDLSDPQVDPEGSLGRTLHNLYETYRDVGQAAPTKTLERRIEALETKVDEIHDMLAEILARTE